MPISTDATVEYFDTETLLTVASPSAVNDGDFSTSSDVIFYNNPGDALYASIVLTFEVMGMTGPDAGSSVVLYNRFADLVDVAPGAHESIPSASYKHARIGTFLVDTSSSEQVVSTIIKLPSAASQIQYVFYIENKTGQKIDNNKWSLHINTKADGAIL